jgi:multiple sugar transport system substrate-binding protein
VLVMSDTRFQAPSMGTALTRLNPVSTRAVAGWQPVTRRAVLKSGAAAAAGTLLGGCGRPVAAGKRRLTVWHPWGGVQAERITKVLAEYRRLHPEIELRAVYIRNDLSTNQKFFTSIAAGAPPDVCFVDGPQVASWAEWGALQPLDDQIRASGIRPEDYFPPTWRQNVYRDHVWALTYCADPNFAFVWNKAAFRRVGLDPEVPPRTIEELTDFAFRLTEVDANGVIQNIGLVPWGQYERANSMFTWGWVFGGEFYDDAARKITADHPRVVRALEWMISFAKKFDPSKMQSMQDGFGTAEQDPFYSGKLAMKCLHIGGIGEIERYAPNLEYGMTSIPAPPDGEQNCSWVGGWCMGIPTGSHNPDLAWEFMRYLCHDPAGTAMVGRNQWVFPGMRHSPYFAEVKPRPNYGPFAQILERSRHQRPVMPVQAFYMRALYRAVDTAVYGRMTPAESLALAGKNTQAELDLALAG